MKYILLLLFLIGVSIPVFSQDDDNGLILGKTTRQSSAAVYDVSDPNGVNIEVNLWGFIRLPGRYIVPVKTTFMDLMSYAGGPTENSDLKEIRIIRNGNEPGEKPTVMKLDYEDLLWNEKVKTTSRLNPELKSGDVIIIQEGRRYTLRDNIGFFLPIATTIITIATFILTLTIYKQ
jgi:hypothetical protein